MRHLRHLALLLVAMATAVGTVRTAAGHEPGEGGSPREPEIASGGEAPESAEEPPLARTGPYLGTGAFAALADFDTSLDVDDTWGGRWLLGYRFHPHIAGELRGEVFSHFDLNGFGLSADLKGWSAAAFSKIYAFTGRLQPYFTLGVGAFVGDLEIEVVATGASSHDSSNAASLLQLGLGLDVPISEHLYLNFEGTYAVLGDDLDGANFGALGLGLGYKF